MVIYAARIDESIGVTERSRSLAWTGWGGTESAEQALLPACGGAGTVMPEGHHQEFELSAQSFASRLNHLIATVHPRGRGSYTNKELAEAVQARGVRCTPQYIGQLRAHKHVPSLEMAGAIARIFGVPTDYFNNPDVACRADEQLAFLASLRDAGVTAVALRAAGLSADGLETLHSVIDRIRAEEGLPVERLGPPEPGQPND